MYQGEELFKTRPAKGNVDVLNHDGFNFNGTVTQVADMGDGAFKFCGTIDSYDGINTWRIPGTLHSSCGSKSKTTLRPAKKATRWL